MNAAASPVRSIVDRVSALDLSNLRVEEHGFPMHVAGLGFVDAGPLCDPAGQLRLAEIRQYVEQRIKHARRLHQVLSRPRRGRPFWVDDDRFDITCHVRTRALPAPGDEETLLATCCELNDPPLDRSRPLWEIWLLTGLVEDRVGLLIRLHHVIADGIAALALLAPLFDPVSGAQAAGATPPGNPGDSTRPGALTSAARHRRARPLITAAAANVGPAAAYLPMWLRQFALLARQGRAPMTSLNRPVGRHRRVVLHRGDLAAVKAVAHSHDGKVNDVVLAAVAGGARRLLEGRGELTPNLVLKVSVAASIRQPADAGAGGNRVGIRVVDIPVGEPHPEQIVAETTAQRRRPPYQPNGRFVQRWMVGMMFHQRLVNVLVSNVPGPPAPLYFAGAAVRELFQLSVVQGNLALDVGVLSYAGQLNFDIVVDADVIPDVTAFTEGLADTLQQLGADRPQRFV
jgi:diacylglycerol O-acyltransferase / wax synthase